MSEKINKALAHITDECKGNEHLIPFEEYLTSICTTDDVAEKILNRDKSLKGCFEKMKSIARGRAKNNCAYIPPEEGLQIIRDYYGIKDNKKAGPAIDIMDLL